MAAEFVSLQLARLNALPLAGVLAGSHPQAERLAPSIRVLAFELKVECECMLALEQIDRRQKAMAQAGFQIAEQVLTLLSKDQRAPGRPDLAGPVGRG
ncbi:hypothetical protein ACLBXM_09070 [Xanthobacteraceae bacterium A53D]